MQTASNAMSRPESKAFRTCVACKDRKRKCGREIPSCSYCEKKKVTCDYSKFTSSHKYSSASKTALLGFSGISRPRHAEITFPVVFFLDSRLFRQTQMEIPRAILPVPSSITNLIGNAAAIELVSAQYFENVHIWLPFISKKRLHQNLLSPLSLPRADVALLLLCMKLIVWLPYEHGTMEDPQTSAYFTAKRFLVEVETAGILTVQVSQACILLTLYEIGHAMYPSAYLSIGTCARYVMALGINGRATNHTTEASVWVKQEERRRIWWVVVILDRFANLGCPERPLSTPDLRSDDLLPVDDIAWDQGIITYNDEFTVFSPANLSMGMFARFAQATNLLAQVLRHVSDTTSNEKFDAQEAIQLDRTIRSLINLTNVEGHIRQTAVCLQIAVCYSALMALHNLQSLEVRKNLSEEMVILCRAFLVRITWDGKSMENASPLMLYWAYQAASTYALLYLETRDEEHLVSWGVVKETLRVLNERWRAAGAYLQILETRNAMEIS